MAFSLWFANENDDSAPVEKILVQEAISMPLHDFILLLFKCL